MLSFSSRLPLAILLSLSSALALAEDSPPRAAADASTADADAGAETGSEDLVDLADLRAFAAVYNEVRKSYVEPVASKDLMKAAIRGLLADLDPHSEYLDNDQLFALQDDASGSYGGLGLEVQLMDGKLTVISPIDETPAARAGLRSGDVIVEIDGIPVDVDATTEAVDAMRGRPGSKVKLSVFREGGDPFRVELVREVIKVTSVRSRLLDLKLREEKEKQDSVRRSQVGSGDRSAKIRTYNFPQNRVTDHRINLTLHRLDSVMEGGIQPLLEALRLADVSERMEQAGLEHE